MKNIYFCQKKIKVRGESPFFGPFGQYEKLIHQFLKQKGPNFFSAKKNRRREIEKEIWFKLQTDRLHPLIGEGS